LVQVARPPFDMEYVASREEGIRPVKEPILRIKDWGPEPADREIMDGRIARVRRRVPNILVWMIFSISAVGVSAKGTGIS